MKYVIKTSSLIIAFSTAFLLYCIEPADKEKDEINCKDLDEIKIVESISDTIVFNDFQFRTVEINPDTLTNIDTLKIYITHGCECGEHDFDLYGIGSTGKVEFFLSHNNNGDLCKALCHVRFNYCLNPVREFSRPDTNFVSLVFDDVYPFPLRWPDTLEYAF